MAWISDSACRADNPIGDGARGANGRTGPRFRKMKPAESRSLYSAKLAPCGS